MAYPELHAIIRRVVHRHLVDETTSDGLQSKLRYGIPHENISTDLKSASSQFDPVAALRGKHPSAHERRMLIARCRQVRADINAFEAKFRAQHGQDPKGLADRHPIAHVYEDYRKLKAVIREDAAKHIQTVWRGHLVRRQLNPQLYINFKNSRKGHGNNRQAEGKDNRVPQSSASDASLKNLQASWEKLLLLREEKATLKRLLRAFDNNFASKNGGRLPNKAEKEHLRPHYTGYHDLKALITDAEANLNVTSLQGPPDDLTFSPEFESQKRQIAQAKTLEQFVAISRTDFSRSSQPRGVNSPNNRSSNSLNRRNDTATSASAGSDAFIASSGVGTDTEDDDHEPMHDHENENDYELGRSNSYSKLNSSSSDLSKRKDKSDNDIAALKVEKKKLQAYLRDYEKDFEAKNNRPVKYVKDIAPVVNKYQRYKALKAKLREHGIGSSNAK